ncbi:Transforming acidic coiled-coil-containing protein 3 [Coemansia sp. BCRC 34301]|nr:Transforming acidic coiled-coil-containing protein 3 [Coemansia sp. BCRC 34301]
MQEGIDRLKDYLRTESAINASTTSLDVSSEPSTPKRSSVCRSTHLAHPGTFSAAQLGRCDERATDKSACSWYHSSATLLGERFFAGMGREELSPARLIASPPLSRQPSGEHCNQAMFARKFGPDEVVAAAAAGMDASAIIALYTDNTDLSIGVGVGSSSQMANIQSTGGRRTPESAHRGSSDDSCRASSKTVADTGGSYMDDAHVAHLLGYLPADDVELEAIARMADGTGRIGSVPALLSGTPAMRPINQNACQAESPVFTVADMECVHREYRDKANMQNEVRDKLVQTLRDEYSESAKSQQIKATKTLHSLKHEHRQQLAAQEQEFARRITTEQQRHAREISQQALAVQTELDELRGGFAAMRAERDDVQAILDEYVATSTRLVEQRDEESGCLSHELGRLTLDRHRLQEQLSESSKCVEILTAESSESHEKADALAAENTRLEKLVASLRADILVAEERSAKIKVYAEDMLSKANAEISRLLNITAQTQEDLAAARARVAKADTRSKSLQIQLDSTKRQNEELLSLCERLEGSIK